MATEHWSLFCNLRRVQYNIVDCGAFMVGAAYNIVRVAMGRGMENDGSQKEWKRMEPIPNVRQYLRKILEEEEDCFHSWETENVLFSDPARAGDNTIDWEPQAALTGTSMGILHALLVRRAITSAAVLKRRREKADPRVRMYILFIFAVILT